MRSLSCLLSPVAKDGKNGDGVELEKKLGQYFQVLVLCLQQSPKKYYG